MAECNEHLVVVMLEPMPAGEEFEIWPPHITIVPWFPCEDERRLDGVLTEVAQRHQAFEVRAGKTEKWGDKDKFEVLKVDDLGELHQLHRDVFRNLEQKGFPVHQKEYLGEKYTPHVTLRNFESRDYHLPQGTVIEIGRFSLIRQVRLKGSGRMIKSLVKDYELG